jgi:hypothetical protein
MKKKFEDTQKALLAELAILATKREVPNRVAKIEEVHKRLNAIQRCLKNLPQA